MSHIRVEGLCVNYPLYGRSRAAAGIHEVDSDIDRMVRDKKGRVVGVRALQGVTFEAAAGERIALLGENGSGKTTLLQVLAGIYSPDSGVVEVEGRTTALVNINLGMNAEATGHRNITLRGLASGRTRAEIEDKRAEIAAFSELGDFLNLPVETYSAGMRMRLSFAIATAFEPDVLILDEWLSAGDSAFRKKATERMRNFVDKAGILVLASHSPSLLIDTCQRALWLDAGHVRAEGDVKEILQAYGEEMERRQVGRDERAQVQIAAAVDAREAKRLKAEARANRRRPAKADTGPGVKTGSAGTVSDPVSGAGGDANTRPSAHVPARACAEPDPDNPITRLVGRMARMIGR
ncbi:MAG: ABC transporter ATP-binding protein [Oceanicaulis sp.]|nr:ABC transporter ATP-binding protein [Oceanicaulis sp.]